MASRQSERVSLASPAHNALHLKEIGEVKKPVYDVFISFRGKDTRNNFTDHLYSALHQKGIITFKDDQKLVRGNTISQEIIQATESSTLSIVIFSENYASSVWCLNELEKIYMRMKAQKLTVLPVFYHVKPSDVREQTGRFGELFAMHRENCKNLRKVESWKAAMTEVAELSGWDVQDRGESEVIKEIVDDILANLRSGYSSVVKELVGINSYVEDIISIHLATGSNDICMLGICGMGGIGKTTIARVVYEKICSEFEGSSFLADVREVAKKDGLVHLQEQLLSEILMDRNTRIWDTYKGAIEIENRLRRKKVLIVVDDVDGQDQLRKLVGMRDWFGSGSLIIITTIDEHFLISHGVDKILKVEGLNPDDALQLFSLKAFRCNHPAEEYMEMCKNFIDYANGLPLALEVLGSFLCGRSVNEWRSALNRLKEIPNKDILDKLKISFDGLKEVEKKIFLDIACFFKGKKKDYVSKILDCCGLYPDIGLKILMEKSLINISENKVCMHNLLQEMGHEIVKQSSQEPGKRSRLWLYEDVHHVFMENTGTENVEGIVLELAGGNEHFNAKAFSQMKRLRMLKLQNFYLSGGLHHLSNELQYLEWYKYPCKAFPSSFQPYKLVELKICRSQIQQLWKEIKPMEKLKFVDISYSMNFRKTPDFRAFPNLEILNLEGCTKMVEIHPSIGVLKRLVSLNLKDCNNVTSLPSSICYLERIQILHLSGCAKLGRLPEDLGNITSLKELDLGRTSVRELPSSVCQLKGLQVLSLHGHKRPKSKSWLLQLCAKGIADPTDSVVPSLTGFQNMIKLDLSYCSLTEQMIPDNLSCLYLLEKLNLSGNDFISLPQSISYLFHLKVLLVDDCKKLELLPELPPDVEYVGMLNCSSLLAIPNQSESKNSSKPFLFSFTNGSKLIELQGRTGASFWWRFRKRLYLLLKTKPQELFHFNVCLPGIIPWWLSYLQGLR